MIASEPLSVIHFQFVFPEATHTRTICTACMPSHTALIWAPVGSPPNAAHRLLRILISCHLPLLTAPAPPLLRPPSASSAGQRDVPHRHPGPAAVPALPAKAFKHLAKVRVHVMCQGGPSGCVIGSIVTEFS